MSPPLPPPVVVLTGPTAAGKTELALRLAGPLGAEIVSVDSRQVYRHLDLGTAKPSAADREQARHHLIDLIEPEKTYSAGRFARSARAVISALHARGRTALLVGGSGLYLSALVDGLFRAAASPAVRCLLAARREAEGLPVLYEELGRLDPASHATLSPKDEVRILRALELALEGRGSRAERWDVDSQPGLARLPLMICAARCREELYRRIDARAAALLDAGWVEEVDGLLQRGVPRTAPGLQILGYAEVVGSLLDGVPRRRVLERIRRRTRRYAKRQITWFRRDRRLRWLDLDRWGLDGARDRILRQWEAQTGAAAGRSGSAAAVDSAS